MHRLAVGRFENDGKTRDARVVDQDRNPSSPISPSPMCACRSAWLPKAFAVIGMDDFEALQSNRQGEFFHHGLVACGRPQVVTGGEDVAGVQADGQAFVFFHLLEDAREVSEARSQIRPVPPSSPGRPAPYIPLGPWILSRLLLRRSNPISSPSPMCAPMCVTR